MAKRLLNRFLAQGFVHQDLSRACVGQTEDAIPRVIVLGRLSLYGERAARLHDEVVAVSARWIAPEARKGPLRPHAEEGKARSLDLLDKALTAPRTTIQQTVQKNLLASLARDVGGLLPHLVERGEELAQKAMEKLTDRGQKEAKAMADILEKQRERIQKALKEDPQRMLEFDEAEKRQLEAERKHMRTRAGAIQDEMEREPERIRNAYVVKARRLEPVGVVYLWPVSS